jgi:hypothetical protein
VQGFVRQSRFWLLFLGLLALSSPARAWVERTVVSDSVTLDLEHSGAAVVSHEILLSVRGGPLADFYVDPVDADAELLSEATATLAKSGQAAGWPLPLSVTKDGTKVRLHSMVGKGLRSGKYLVRFSYRSDFAASNHLGTRVGRTVVEWSGPSFIDGIDSVRVVFRVPRGSVPPRLPSASAGDATLIEDEQGGVFLATFRRAGEKDELEVVRPHVAKSEIVVWRAVVDGSTFDLPGRPAAPAPVVDEPPSMTMTTTAPVPRSPPKNSDTVPVLIACGLGALYAVLTSVKSWLVASACARRGASPSPLLPMHSFLRAVLAGAGMAFAVFLVHFGFPTPAAASLLVALAAAVHVSPRAPLAPRGPGQWTRLEDTVFDDDVKPPALPGRYFDVSSARGFVVFVVLLGGVAAAAIYLGRRSSYEGVAAALGASTLFPLFFTGRLQELPPDAWTAPRPLVEWLFEVLGKNAALSVHPIGRIPLGRTRPDELRLVVMPRNPRKGLVAIEVGLDVHQSSLGYLELPFVILRVQDGAAAADALPRGLLWTRGRSADERVAVLRPKVPTRRLTARLVMDVARRLEAPKRQPISASKSGGKASSAANDGTRASPAHAT